MMYGTNARENFVGNFLEGFGRHMEITNMSFGDMTSEEVENFVEEYAIQYFAFLKEEGFDMQFIEMTARWVSEIDEETFIDFFENYYEEMTFSTDDDCYFNEETGEWVC